MFRSFIAIDIPSHPRSALERAQAKLKLTRAHVGWVPAPNIHLTLAFLGDISESAAEALGFGLDRVAAETAPFTFEVHGVGSYGSGRSPRVIWAGVKDCEPLNELHARITEVLIQQDLRVEDRVFKPHLTLGRVRSSRGRSALTEAMSKVEQKEFGTVEADRILLMKSTLLPTGAQYSIEHQSPFQR